MPRKLNQDLRPLANILSERLLDETEALYEVANDLFHVNRHEDANNLLSMTLDLLVHAPASKRKEELSASLEMLYGMTLSAGRQTATAEEYLASAIERFSSTENLFGQYLALISEGILLQKIKRHLDALDAFKKAESIDRNHNIEPDSRNRYKLQCNIIETLFALNDTNGLVHQVAAALQWIPRKPCEELFILLIQQANCQTLHADFDGAVATYSLALDVAKELQRLDLQAQSLSRIALCYRTCWEKSLDQSFLEKSISYRQDAARIYLEVGYSEEALTQLREIVSAHQHLERLTDAKVVSLQALSIAMKVGIKEQIFRFSAHAAWLSASLNEHSEALDLYLIAYNSQAPNRSDEQRVVAEIARLYHALGDSNTSIGWFEKSCLILAELGETKQEIEERQVLIYLLNKLGRIKDAESHVIRLSQLSVGKGGP
jgi:tetratricopeptide (TPR) repeat protein